MNNLQKGFIAPILLALVAVLLIGGGTYVYVNNKPTSQPVTASSTTQAISTAQPQDDLGKILLGDRARYENLSAEEKEILDSYADHSLFTNCILKYYDSDKMLVGCGSVKPTLSLSLVERNTQKNIGDTGCSLNLFSGYLESKEYVISVDDGGICYYKAGATNLTLVPNSQFTHKFGDVDGGTWPYLNEETYVNSVGIVDGYDVSFDESTKTLTASVFRQIVTCGECGQEMRERLVKEGVIDIDGNNGVSNNPKIRTVTFVLP